MRLEHESVEVYRRHPKWHYELIMLIVYGNLSEFEVMDYESEIDDFLNELQIYLKRGWSKYKIIDKFQDSIWKWDVSSVLTGNFDKQLRLVSHFPTKIYHYESWIRHQHLTLTKQHIGKYLITQCSEQESCPFKALLPDYDGMEEWDKLQLEAKKERARKRLDRLRLVDKNEVA